LHRFKYIFNQYETFLFKVEKNLFSGAKQLLSKLINDFSVVQNSFHGSFPAVSEIAKDRVQLYKTCVFIEFG